MLPNSNVSSLDGIEIFSNLCALCLPNNNIEDLSPISKLDSLMEIDLSNNKISDISPLGNIKTKYLYSINLSGNDIKDVSCLNNIQNSNESLLDLNISNNKNVTGYEKLKNVWNLNISDCGIKDVSNLNGLYNLTSLMISNTPDIKGLEQLPVELKELDINNCNIDNLEILKNNSTLYTLNVSNNKITSLKGIEYLENIELLNVSNNNIEDWSQLKEINKNSSFPNNEEGDFGEFDYTIRLIADNCNIENITVFNDINLNSLILTNNKIKDVSKFKNDNVDYIDLSNNTNLTGLQGFKNIPIVFLNNCNIKDINEILKLEKVSDLSVEYNELTDITPISKLKNLSSLSLAGNKNIKGCIENENLYILNLSDCDIDNNFVFSSYPHMSCLNISKNNNINEIYKFVSNIGAEYLSVVIDELDFDEFVKIKQEINEKFFVQNSILKLNYSLNINDKTINLSNNKFLKREIMRNMLNCNFHVNNGTIEKNGYIINIENVDNHSVEIVFTNYLNSTVKITFDFNGKNNDTDVNINSNTNKIDSTNNTNTNSNMNTNTNINTDTNTKTNTNTDTNTNTNMNTNTNTNTDVDTNTNTDVNTNANTNDSDEFDDVIDDI